MLVFSIVFELAEYSRPVQQHAKGCIGCLHCSALRNRRYRPATYVDLPESGCRARSYNSLKSHKYRGPCQRTARQPWPGPNTGPITRFTRPSAPSCPQNQVPGSVIYKSLGVDKNVLARWAWGYNLTSSRGNSKLFMVKRHRLSRTSCAKQDRVFGFI